MDHTRHMSVQRGTIDTHCHLSIMLAHGLPVEQILRECAAGGMERVIDIGIAADDLTERRAQFSHHPIVRFTWGVHPMNATDWNDSVDPDAQFRRGGVVAIGETGLDWYRGRDQRDAQMRAFEAQIALANRQDLPVIIHNRDATEDVYNTVRRLPPAAGGVMHCFSEDAGWARRFVDLGFWISFAGNVTYSSAQKLRDAAAAVPIDRILAETDAPYLAPVPARGRKNHPGYVSHSYRALAAVRGIGFEVLVERIAENTAALFDRGQSRQNE